MAGLITATSARSLALLSMRGQADAAAARPCVECVGLIMTVTLVVNASLPQGLCINYVILAIAPTLFFLVLITHGC